MRCEQKMPRINFLPRHQKAQLFTVPVGPRARALTKQSQRISLKFHLGSCNYHLHIFANMYTNTNRNKQSKPAKAILKRRNFWIWQAMAGTINFLPNFAHSAKPPGGLCKEHFNESGDKLHMSDLIVRIPFASRRAKLCVFRLQAEPCNSGRRIIL